MATLLQVRNLRTSFVTSAGVVRAVDGVSWDVQEDFVLNWDDTVEKNYCLQWIYSLFFAFI